jgi:hypothetical protein
MISVQMMAVRDNIAIKNFLGVYSAPDSMSHLNGEVYPA